MGREAGKAEKERGTHMERKRDRKTAMKDSETDKKGQVDTYTEKDTRAAPRI